MTDNTFLGLQPYTEDDAYRFKGRTEESQELFRLIVRNDFTVCYAESGEGKTSLLNAGVSPLLRENMYFPIAIIFTSDDYKITPDSFDSIVDRCIKDRIADYNEKNKGVNFEYKLCSTDFQGLDCQAELQRELSKYSWWKLRNYMPQAMGLTFTPVFVFDQFEEVFNLPGSIAWTKKFFDWLEGVSSDSCPDEIAKKVREIIGDKATFPTIKEEKGFKAVFSLRKEFIGELDYWGMQTHFVPALKDNRYCLKPLTYKGAKKVMTQQERFDEDNVEQVLTHFVGRYSREPERTIAENLPAIPALLLSVVCDTWEKDIHAFSAQNANGIGQSINAILERFYEVTIDSVVNELSCQGRKGKGVDIRSTINDVMIALVDVNGKRIRTKTTSSVLLECGFDSECKKALADKHIVRILKVDGEDYVEIVHDALCPVILKKKEMRLSERIKRQEMQKVRDNELKIVHSLYLAEKANNLVSEGDSFTARLLSLEALPKSIESQDRPYVADAEYALRNASRKKSWSVSTEGTGWNQIGLLERIGCVVYCSLEKGTRIENELILRLIDIRNGYCYPQKNIIKTNGKKIRLFVCSENKVFIGLTNEYFVYEVTEDKQIALVHKGRIKIRNFDGDDVGDKYTYLAYNRESNFLLLFYEGKILRYDIDNEVITVVFESVESCESAVYDEQHDVLVWIERHKSMGYILECCVDGNRKGLQLDLEKGDRVTALNLHRKSTSGHTSDYLALGTYNGNIYYYNITDFSLEASFSIPPNKECVSSLQIRKDILSLSYNEENRMIAAGCFDHNIYLWNMDDVVFNPLSDNYRCPINRVINHRNPVCNVSHLNNCLLSVDFNHNVHLWDYNENNKPVVDMFFGGQITRIWPYERCVVVSLKQNDGSLTYGIANTEFGKEIHDEKLTAIDCDEKWIAYVTKGILFLRNIEDGTIRQVFKDKNLSSLALCKDNVLLSTASRGIMKVNIGTRTVMELFKPTKKSNDIEIIGYKDDFVYWREGGIILIGNTTSLEKCEIYTHTRNNHVVLLPDGHIELIDYCFDMDTLRHEKKVVAYDVTGTRIEPLLNYFDGRLWSVQNNVISNGSNCFVSHSSQVSVYGRNGEEIEIIESGAGKITSTCGGGDYLICGTENGHLLYWYYPDLEHLIEVTLKEIGDRYLSENDRRKFHCLIE